MAEEIKLDLKVDGFQSLRAQLKEAQMEAQALTDKFGEGSAEALAAAGKVGKLRDEIGDAAARANALGTTAGKFQAVTRSIAGLAGGFSALQGTLALVGAESGAVEESIKKVQSAMALTQGLSAIADSVDAFKDLGAVIQASTIFQKANNITTSIAIGIQKAFGVATVGVGNAFKILKLAIASTGIGALIVAAGFLITKLMDWADSTDDAKAAQDRLNASLEKQQALYAAQADALDFAKNLAKKRAELAGQSADQIAAIDANYRKQELAAAQQNSAAILQSLKTFEKERLKTRKDGLLEGSKEDVEAYRATQKKLEEARKNEREINQRNNLADVQDQIDANNRKDQANEKANQKSKERSQQNAQDRIKAAEDARKALQDIGDKEIRSNDNKYTELILSAKEAGKEITDLEIAQLQERQTILQSNYDKQKALLDQQRKQGLLSEKEYKNQLNELERGLGQQIIETANQIREQNLENKKTQADKEKKLAEETADALAVTEEQKTEKEKEELRKRYQNLMSQYAEGSAMRISLEQALANQLAEIDKKVSDKKLEEFLKTQNEIVDGEKNTFAKRLEALNASDEAIKNNTKLTEEERTRLLKENADRRIEIEEEERLAKLDAISKGFDDARRVADALQNISEAVFAGRLKNVQKGSAEEEKLLKKQFQFNKAFQLANALMDGAKAAIASLAQSPVAIGPLPNPAGIASLALVGITTAATVAKILATKYEPSGGGSSGGGQAEAPIQSKFERGGLLQGRKHAEGGMMTPFGELEGGEYVINRSATSAFLPLLNAINGMGNGSGAPNNMSSMAESSISAPAPIIKTYVVATDVTSQQEANKRISDLARL